MEGKAERNSARAFCPVKCITHKYKNKHVFRDPRAEVVLGTFAIKSLGLSRRWGKQIKSWLTEPRVAIGQLKK